MSCFNRVLLVIACILINIQTQSTACTTFSFEDQGNVYMGKTYDWHNEEAILHVNKRHVEKSSLQIIPTDKPLKWVSKYGSLTFNQYGRELPNSGMNEAGLTVEVMVLSSSSYPLLSTKPSVNESQWVQYILDLATSVDEAKDLASKIRISKILIPIHYMVCDLAGKCASFEYIKGDLLITDLAASRNKVLTNNTYEESSKHLKQFEGFGGTKPIPSSNDSLSRFVKASHHIKNLDFAAMSPVEYSFKGLDKVNNSETQWHVVYDVAKFQISFRTVSAKTIKTVDLKDMDFSCNTPVKVLDVINNLEGDVTSRFKEYDEAANSKLVRSSLGANVPEFVINKAIELPGSTKCMDAKSF